MQISKTRLRQAVIAAGYVHPDGRPNKSAFARAFAEAEGKDGSDANVVETYRRQVQRWLGEEGSEGMSRENIERVAALLGIEPDDLNLERLVEALETQQQEAAGVLERLLDQVERLERRLQALEGGALNPPNGH